MEGGLRAVSEAFERRVREYAVEVRAGRSRMAEEERSLYFHDHENHFFELHSGTQIDRLDAYSAPAG